MTKDNSIKTKYYACDICGWNSPSNKQMTDNNGVTTSYCPRHWRREIDDRQTAKRRHKAQDEFIEDFRKSFGNPNVN